jgi:hypothetical protein
MQRQDRIESINSINHTDRSSNPCKRNRIAVINQDLFAEIILNSCGCVPDKTRVKYELNQESIKYTRQCKGVLNEPWDLHF